MQLPLTQKKPQESTRDRILHHAILRFSSQSYDRTGLREIATDASVDVALVHRSFGSKEKLFAECVRAAIELGGILAKPGPEALDALFAEAITPREEGEWSPIDIMVHSFSSEDAARVLREVAMEMVIDPLVKASSHQSQVKIALSTSLLFGFAIMRDVIGVEALKTVEKAELETLLTRAKDALNQDDEPSPQKSASQTQ